MKVAILFRIELFSSTVNQVGHGRYNEDSRLIKFTAKNCPTGLDVYEVHQMAPGDYDDDEEDAVEVDASGLSAPKTPKVPI